MEERPQPLITEEVVQARVARLAAQISQDYADVDTLYLIGILKGAFIFLADLCRRLTVRHRVDFVALASYGDSSQSSGEVRLLMDLRESIAGKHILVVDDIVDTGSTLSYLTGQLKSREPASVKTCVLVSKSKQRRENVAVDYIGFNIPDVWVVGYGLDIADRWRTLPYIASIKPER